MWNHICLVLTPFIWLGPLKFKFANLCMAFNFQYSKKFSKKLAIFYILLFTSICSIPFLFYFIFFLKICCIDCDREITALTQISDSCLVPCVWSGWNTQYRCCLLCFSNSPLGSTYDFSLWFYFLHNSSIFIHFIDKQ